MIAKVDGRWAFVSRGTRKPLAYWNGRGKPPKWWVDKQERRVQYFKHAKPNPRGEVPTVLIGLLAFGIGAGLGAVVAS